MERSSSITEPLSGAFSVESLRGFLASPSTVALRGPPLKEDPSPSPSYCPIERALYMVGGRDKGVVCGFSGVFPVP